MMPRRNVGLKKQKAGLTERKGSKSKKDQRPDAQQETLVDRVTQAYISRD